MNEEDSHPHSRPSWPGRLRYLLIGLASLLWLALRSGTRPSRLAYPCQRAAASNALGFLAYVASLAGSTRLYRYARRYVSLGRLVVLALVLMLTILLQGEAMRMVSLGSSPDLPSWTSGEAISDVFAVTHVPTPTVSLEGGAIPHGTSPADALHDSGVDALVDLMASQGVPFYKTVSQPDGIFGPDDVVVIKVNAQWNCGTGADNRRAHTNSDVVKGVIYRLVQHPEGFTGAVVVADNGQGVPAQLDCADHNNAEDARQSHQDVADAFVGQGYDVCTYTWDGIRTNFVTEYISGSIESGYVAIQHGTPGTDQLSYPKFEVACGSRTYQISMRHGLWNGTSYDNSRLKMVNLPVIKRHGMAGATIAVKNYIGFLTTADRETRFGDFAQMHDFFWGFEGGSDYGLLGRQLALIRRADLNIVDAIWINPVDGWHNEDSAVRTNILLAGTDPFAVDYYASAYVLVPHMSTGSDWAHNADARYAGGDFRGLLMTNENRARVNGMDDVINLDDSLTVEQEQAQFNVFVTNVSAPPQGTISLTVQPSLRSVVPGGTAAYTVSVTASEGFAEPVELELPDAPSWAAPSFDPFALTPPGASQLYVATTTAADPGTYPMTVIGTSGELSDTASLTLVLAAPPVSFTLSISPTTRAAKPNRVVSYTVTINGLNGFAQPVTLAVTGLPTGVSPAWSKNPVTPDDSSVVTLSVSQSAPFGKHPLGIIATTETQTAAEGMELIIDYPVKLYLPVILETGTG